jgi:hypothetical protein
MMHGAPALQFPKEHRTRVAEGSRGTAAEFGALLL